VFTRFLSAGVGCRELKHPGNRKDATSLSIPISIASSQRLECVYMKRGATRHPKTKHLAELLRRRLPRTPMECCHAMAVGYLELLWHFTAEFAPQGDIGKYPDSRIEAALGWFGETRELLEMLRASGWLDWLGDGAPKPHHIHVGWLVHGWSDHADETTRRRLARASLYFVEDTVKVTGKVPSDARQNPDTSRLPEPEPEPEPITVKKQSGSSYTPTTSKPASVTFPKTWEEDADFSRFVADYLALAAPEQFIGEDFTEAWEFCWKKLDYEQRIARGNALKRRETEFQEEPRFMPKPRKFLVSEWKRGPKPPARNGKASAEELAAMTKGMEDRRRAERNAKRTA
jgi:hypothetical protein